MSDTVHPGWDPTRLRQAREAAGLTQEDAAAELTALSETQGFIPTLRAVAVPRVTSPRGGSTFTTSAPTSASRWVATGPAMPNVHSTMRIPSRTPAPIRRRKECRAMEHRGRSAAPMASRGCVRR